MKKMIFLALIIPLTANAWDNPDIEQKYERKQEYKSSFGNKYDYDLSRTQDRIRYETDYDAQKRDRLDVNPMREIERDLGEHGAGVRR